MVVGHGLVLRDKNITFIAPDRLDETNGGLGMTWKLPFDPGDPCRLGGPFHQPPSLQAEVTRKVKICWSTVWFKTSARGQTSIFFGLTWIEFD